MTPQNTAEREMDRRSREERKYADWGKKKIVEPKDVPKKVLMIKCSRCEKVLPATRDFFGHRKAYKNRNYCDYFCNICKKQYNQEWNKKHPGRVKKYNRERKKVQKIEPKEELTKEYMDLEQERCGLIDDLKVQEEKRKIIYTTLDSLFLQYENLEKIDNELEEIKKEKELNNIKPSFDLEKIKKAITEFNLTDTQIADYVKNKK